MMLGFAPMVGVSPSVDLGCEVLCGRFFAGSFYNRRGNNYRFDARHSLRSLAEHDVLRRHAGCMAQNVRVAPRCSMAGRPVPMPRSLEGSAMIRKLKSGEYRLYSVKKDVKTGRRRNLGTFSSLEAAKQHEREVQYFKRH
jgi:hypothetical protein